MGEAAQPLPSACILCSENCGILTVPASGHLTRIRGDRNHPSSAGYLCEKAQALDHYQNHADRLDRPLRRSSDGRLEEVSWETALREIAERIRDLREQHGPTSMAFYGGAGQGNQLHLAWAVAFRLAIGSPYLYHALGQEKTGEFWLDGALFGSQACHTSPDIAHTELVMLSGTNPWHAHGFPRARNQLREISRDPARTMIVVDPRRTRTAELADHHLALRPGTDAFLFAAMLAVIVGEGLEDREFLERRTTGFERVREKLLEVDVDTYARRAGLDPARVRDVARRFATASSACVRSDLGLQQSYHSTLNLYLEKLLVLLTGNFGRRGGNNIHAQTIPLLWHSDPSAPDWEQRKTRVTGMIPIAGFYPPNILPAEIDSEHPARIRGLVVDSANPAVTSANSEAYRRAFRKLELLVAVDTSRTETTELAHYVLPAASQFEKYECTFFNWGFPVNHLHVRHPVLPVREGCLPEQEIYRRLALAISDDPSSNPLLGPLLQVMEHPALKQLSPDLRAAAAPLFIASQQFVEQHRAAVLRAGIEDRGQGLGAALFERIVGSPSGTEISHHRYEDTFSFIRHPDGRIHLDVDLMFRWMDDLRHEAASEARSDPEFPFVLCAGERRSSNATTNLRDPAWRPRDPDGALAIHPADARALGVADGDRLLVESRTGSIEVEVRVDEGIQPSCVSLPHGFGLGYTGSDGERVVRGPAINALTASDHCDPLAKTPYHKTVPVRLRRPPAPGA